MMALPVLKDVTMCAGSQPVKSTAVGIPCSGEHTTPHTPTHTPTPLHTPTPTHAHTHIYFYPLRDSERCVCVCVCVRVCSQHIWVILKRERGLWVDTALYSWMLSLCPRP